MGVKIREKKGYLYLDVIQGRLHHWEALHIRLSDNATDRKEQLRFAESCRAKRELQLALGEWDFVDNISGRQLLVDYMQKIAEERNARSPYLRCLQWVKKCKDGGRVQLSAVSEMWCSSFQKFLITSGRLAETTANTMLVNLKYTFNRAIREGILQKNPAQNVKRLKVPENEKPVLTVEEISAVFATPPITKLEEPVRRAFLFACQTGLRYSDLQTLAWKHIEKRTLSKYNQFQYWIKKEQVKTKDTVEIPLSRGAYELIKPMNFPDVLIFKELSERTSKVTNDTLKRICKRAGIEKKVSWHTARRTFATLELESGADPFTVQSLMGHKSITMTSIYAKSNNIKSGAIKGLENMLNQTDTQQIKSN